MPKFWSIFIHELITQVWRPSYWFGVLGLPLISIILFGVVGQLDSQHAAANSNTTFASFSGGLSSLDTFDSLRTLMAPPEDTRQAMGVVDLAGVTRLVPPDIDLDDYVLFASQADAQQGQDLGRVRAYYLIPADFIQTGQVLYYADSLSVDRALALDSGLDYWMRYNLANGDGDAVLASLEPVTYLNETNLDPANAPRFNVYDSTSLGTLTMVLYFVIFLLLMSSWMILSSFNRESENRVMEVLLVSTTSEQILWAKFTALILIGLGQIALWLAGASLFGARMGAIFALQALDGFSPALFRWVLLFSSLSFIFYGAMMMGVATRFPNLREGSILTGGLVMPLIMPLFLALIYPQTPNHPVFVLASLFPLTAPTTLLVRMMLTDVPLWQPMVSAALLVSSAVLTMRFVARSFLPAHLLPSSHFQGIGPILKAAFKRR